MEDEERAVSRRDFIVGSAGLWISASMARPLAAAEAESDPRPRALREPEWTLVEAITGRILPSDDTPGAIEAGCVNFIDKALANEDAAALPLYRSALAELDRFCVRRTKKRFVELDPEAQDEILVVIESGRVSGWSAQDAEPGAFFQTIRMHTILGFSTDPKYGGNRDYAGWKTMGVPGSVHHLGGSSPEQMVGEVEFVPVWARGAAGHSKPPPDGDGAG